MGSIVYTGGTFDLFHSGHVNLLKRCREIAGEDGWVVASVNKGDFIEKFKGNPPVCSDVERAAVVLACQYVDEVVFNLGGEDSKISIELANPDYIVVGSDWAKKDYHAQMQFTQEWLDERGIGLVYVPYSRDISSTEIKRRMSK
jgi:glycerol-3-phosphate cytidylyltransferase